jgi:hypothetical protein
VVDLKSFIDVHTLPEHELGHIEFVLNSPAYRDHFEPFLKKMRDSMAQTLLSPTDDRKSKLPDDFLRGGITVIDNLLSLFNQLIEETSMDKLHEALTAKQTNEAGYEELRLRGLTRPAGQTAQPASPDDIEEF